MSIKSKSTIRQSHHKYLKELIKERGYKCDICKRADFSEIHHENYIHGKQGLKAVKLVCYNCHHKIHAEEMDIDFRKVEKEIEYKILKIDGIDVYSWNCPNCNKQIASLFKDQFLQNFVIHKLNCDKHYTPNKKHLSLGEAGAKK